VARLGGLQHEPDDCEHDPGDPGGDRAHVTRVLASGGVLRSLVLHRTPQVFRPGELTALAALGGTLVYGALSAGLHLDENAAGLVAIVVVAATNWASRRYRFETRAAWSPQIRRRRDSLSTRVPARPRP
jgi:hypothetical protein